MAETDTNDAPIIILRGVHKWYGQFHVLKDLNLDVWKGQKVVVCGPSGSGKSTMIRCINRLEEHQRGHIVVDGIELTGDVRNVDAIRREVGMVFQHFNLFPHLTVLENLTLAPTWVRRAPKARRRRPRWNCSSGSASPSRRTNIRASCRAASSSASRSPGRCA